MSTPDAPHRAVSAHARTGQLVIIGVWVCAVIVMVASANNAGAAFAALGQPRASGIALGVAVDVALAVALWGDRALHLTGRTVRWGRRLRLTTAVMSLALNSAVAGWQGQWGVAAFHAFLPVLLIVLTEAAQAYTLEFRAIADEKIATDLAVERARRWEADETARQAADLARVEREHQEQQLVATLAACWSLTAVLTAPRTGTSPRRPTRRTTAPPQRRTGSTTPRGGQKRGESPRGGRPAEYPDAVGWAVGELAAGRPAGRHTVAGAFPGLSEHYAKTAALEAKQQHEQRPRLSAVGT